MLNLPQREIQINTCKSDHLLCWWDCGETDILLHSHTLLMKNTKWYNPYEEEFCTILQNYTNIFTSPTSKNLPWRYNSTNTKQIIENTFTVALFIMAKDWKQYELHQKRLTESTMVHPPNEIPCIYYKKKGRSSCINMD